MRERVSAWVYVRASGCGCTGAGEWMRACSLTYPASNALASYCLRPLRLYHIFRHYLINGTIWGREGGGGIYLT